MYTQPRTPDLRAALAAGLLLCALSAALLWAADEAVDAAAIAGAVGLVLAGALLGLSLLSWRWSARGASYVDVEMGVRREDVAVRDTVAADDDAAAV